MFSLILLALIPVVITQSMSDPCFLNQCKDGELCIAKDTQSFMCINEKLLRNLIFDTPLNNDASLTQSKPLNILPTTEKRPIMAQDPTLGSGSGWSMPTTMTGSTGMKMPTTMTGSSGMKMPTTMTGSSGMSMPSTMTGSNGMMMPSTMTGSNGMMMPSTMTGSSGMSMPTTMTGSSGMKVPTQESMRMVGSNGRLGNFVSVQKSGRVISASNKQIVQKPVKKITPVVQPVPKGSSRTIMRDDVLPDTITTQDICKGFDSGEKVAYPFDNSKFVMCNPPGTGVVMQCPPTLKFNSFRKRCDYTDAQPQPACLSNPCQNGGLCTDLPDFSFKCQCFNGFSGDRCEKGSDPCSLNPCGSNGMCKTFGFTTPEIQYYCLCDNGRGFGLSCDQQVFSNPCLNDMGESYYAVPFSTALFIHCESQTINLKACTPPLRWLDNIKQCDRPL